ncbi:MAG TPA: hypothetical protein VIO60_09545, partial [Rectinemataceae bacterium]
MRRIFALGLAALLACGAWGQESEPEAAVQGQAQPKAEQVLASMSELERKTLAMSIAVSTYRELRDMAALYALPLEGSSADLRTRLYAFFGLQPPVPAKIEGDIQVENASSAQYFSLEGGKGRAVKLTGPLTVKVNTDDGFTHTITAGEIIFNQDALLAKAQGDVLYTRAGQGRKDEFRGESVTVDLANYRGVFIDGSYDLQPGAGRSRTLSFEFKSLARRSPSLSVLDDASVTACDESEPHYRIRAGRVWLFGSGDWALSNATLYVGHMPLLWLPFFYYPADEVIFHPVIGYRAREGAFAQTTTYLLGSLPQKAERASSSLSLFSTSGGGKERQGLFLKLKPGLEETGKGKDRLALLVDAYSSLGAMAGVEGHWEFGPGKSLDAKAALGLSRSVFLQSNGYYSPLDSAGGYESVWNGTSLLGAYLPFRFGAELGYKASGSSSGLRYTVSVQAPFFGDPFFEQDFYQRAASASILSVFDANETALNKRSSMTQSLSGSLAWNRQGAKVPSFLETASLSKIAAQMTWKSKAQSTAGLSAAQKRLLAVDPQREFFYPDSLRFLDAAFSLGGSLYRIEDKSIKSSLAWTASGSATGEDKFRSSIWASPQDVDGSLSYLLFGLKGVLGLSSDTSLASGLLRFKASIGMNVQSQLRPWLYDERISPTTVHPYLLAD